MIRTLIASLALSAIILSEIACSTSFASVIGPLTFASDVDYDNANPPANPAPNGVFRDFINGSKINRGADMFTESSPGPFNVTALNFNDGTNAGVTSTATLYDVDPTNTTPTLFTGTTHLSMDVIQQETNGNQAGLVALFNEGTGQRGLALTIRTAGNTDRLVLHNLTQTITPDAAGLTFISLGSSISTNVWYRLTMDVSFDAGPFSGSSLVTVTGKVFGHIDPSSAVGAQIGTTLTYSGSLSSLGLDTTGTGQVGMLHHAGATTNKASLTNVTITTPATLSSVPLANSLVDFGLLTPLASDTDIATISNTGTLGSVLTVSSASLGGTNPSLFALDPSFSPSQLIAGGGLTSANFGIKFLGSAIPGTYSATLSFATSEGSVNYNLLATVVPEPNSLALIACAGFGVAWLRRRAI